MPSAGRKGRLTKQPYWFTTNGIEFYGFVGSDDVFGSVGWTRVPDRQHDTDRSIWWACLTGDFDSYREFDDKALAKVYIEALVALNFN